MKRREFGLLAGSTVLSSATIGSSVKSSVAVDFKISQVPKEDPKNVDSLILEFSQLDLVPQYLDDQSSLDVSATVTLEGIESKHKTVSVGFDNGSKISIDDIQSENGGFGLFKFSDITTDGSVIKGIVEIGVSNKEIDRNYRQIFYVSAADVFHDTFEDQDLSEWTVDYDLNSSISSSYNASKNGSYSLVPATQDFDRASSYSVLLYQDGFSVQPPFVEFSYITTDTSGGGLGMALYNDSGDIILYMGSTNGQVGMNAGSGSEQITGSESYSTWNRVRAEFSWSSNDVTVYYDELENDNIPDSSASQSFKNNSDSVSRVEFFATDGSNNILGTGSNLNIVSNAYYVDNCFAPISQTKVQYQKTRFE